MRSSPRRSAGTADALIGGLAEPLALYAASRSGSSSAGCTPASAAIEIGTNEKPMPIAISRNPGRRSRGTSRRPTPA
jgi:hypothetical protein